MLYGLPTTKLICATGDQSVIVLPLRLGVFRCGIAPKGEMSLI